MIILYVVKLCAHKKNNTLYILSKKINIYYLCKVASANNDKACTSPHYFMNIKWNLIFWVNKNKNTQFDLVPTSRV